MRTLVALKPHPYEGRHKNVGDQYFATDADARLLVLAGQAEDTGEAAPDASNQTYKTRDLSATRTRRNKGLNA